MEWKLRHEWSPPDSSDPAYRSPLLVHLVTGVLFLDLSLSSSLSKGTRKLGLDKPVFRLPLAPVSLLRSVLKKGKFFFVCFLRFGIESYDLSNALGFQFSERLGPNSVSKFTRESLEEAQVGGILKKSSSVTQLVIPCSFRGWLVFKRAFP